MSASTTIACTLSLQPYLWDGLRGVRAPLSPDRYDLIPLDERVDADRDALGWTVHGKAHVHTMFRYEVRDRRTGRTVLSDVAQLDCSDRPVDPDSAGTWSNAELLRTIEASLRPLPDACSRRALGGAPCFEGDGLSPPVLDRGADPSTDASRPTVGLGLGLLVGGATFASSTVYLARVGLQAGVGGFVSDRVYVGGAVGGVMATDVESGELVFAGQVGPEVRIGLRPMKEGHGVRVSPLGTWVGFKAGYQTAGLGPEGGFVEASLGVPVLALTAGVDVGPPRSGGAGAFVEPYLGLSVHLDLGW